MQSPTPSGARQSRATAGQTLQGPSMQSLSCVQVMTPPEELVAPAPPPPEEPVVPPPAPPAELAALLEELVALPEELAVAAPPLPAVEPAVPLLVALVVALVVPIALESLEPAAQEPAQSMGDRERAAREAASKALRTRRIGRLSADHGPRQAPTRSRHGGAPIAERALAAFWVALRGQALG